MAGITMAEAARRLRARPADDAAVAAILAGSWSDSAIWVIIDFHQAMPVLSLSAVPPNQHHRTAMEDLFIFFAPDVL
ncbi:hypothetical protein [Nonomuraea zeae]|uniref:Uncharacterized protein n=1 Tax=Nonomuraea zeae TaxID=1642303 RepID=A0A5S4GRP3_9ACTN|nr:hypothetical protein [Nonomuraea zeae]TMR35583.1 hypothetical protein ETD85_13375 [Nonomuraea zeae]